MGGPRLHVSSEERVPKSARDALTAKSAQVWVESVCAAPVTHELRTALAGRENPIDPDVLESTQAEAVEPLSFAAAKDFARQVWPEERPGGLMVQVSRQEDLADAVRSASFSSDAAAEARWKGRTPTTWACRDSASWQGPPARSPTST